MELTRLYPFSTIWPFHYNVSVSTESKGDMHVANLGLENTLLKRSIGIPLILVVPFTLLSLAKPTESGAAGLQPGLPHHVPQRELTLHGLHRPLVNLHGLLHGGQDGVKRWLRVGSPWRGFWRVPRQIVEQRGIMVGDVVRRAEANLRVEASCLVFWGEVRCEVKGFPHGATCKTQNKNQ